MKPQHEPQVLLYQTDDGLTRNLAAGDILLLHDGHAARTRAGQPVILAVLPRLLEAAAAAGLKSITLRSALAISQP